LVDLLSFLFKQKVMHRVVDSVSPSSVILIVTVKVGLMGNPRHREGQTSVNQLKLVAILLQPWIRMTVYEWD
jgi:hypothetical protein